MHRFILVAVFAAACGGQQQPAAEPPPPAAPAPPAATALSATAAAILERTGVEFQRPPGFADVPVQDVEVGCGYLWAIKAQGREFEVRYRVDPLDTMIAEYEQCQATAGCTLPHPDRAHDVLLRACGRNISANRDDLQEPVPLPPEIARGQGADAAAAMSITAVNRAFAPYDHGVVVVYQRNAVAVIMIMILFNDEETGEDDSGAEAMSAVRFVR